MPDLQALHAKALIEGRALIDAEIRKDIIIEIVIQYIPSMKMKRNPCDLESQVDELTGREDLASDLRAAGFSDWATWLTRRRCAIGLSGLATDVAVDLLMGRAAGRYFATNPKRESIFITDEILAAFPDGWRDFASSAAESIDAEPLQRAALIDFLREQVRSFADGPLHLGSMRAADIRSLIEVYQKAPRVRHVWEEHPSDFLIRLEQTLEFDVLRRCDAQAFLTLIDAFPHPEPGRQILHVVGTSSDFNDLLALFEVAPLAFDHNGIWQSQVKSPLLVLSEIFEKLPTLAQPISDVVDTNTPQEPSDAFKSAVDELIAAILARADGQFLGYAWLQHLIASGRLERRRLIGKDSPLGPSYRFLLLELASALPARADVLAWIKAEEEPWRYRRAVAALAAISLGQKSGANVVAEHVESVLACQLLSPGGLDESIAERFTPERFMVGRSLSTIDGLATWFASLWKRLMPLRDRARHRSDCNDDKVAGADIILISWSLCALEYIPPDQPEARAFWLEIHRAICETRLTQISEVWAGLRTQYRFLAGLLALRLRQTLDGSAREDLQSLFAPLLWLDITLADVLSMLRAMDVPIEVIKEAVPDVGRLRRLLQQVLDDDTELRKHLKIDPTPYVKQSEQIISLIADLRD